MNVAIIGCGLIGQKRAGVLGNCKLTVCADVVLAKAKHLAGAHDAFATTDWRDAVSRPDVDAVIISAVHDVLPMMITEALHAKKHVLVEKPAARRSAELDPVIALADITDVRVRVGFNHRYHPALQKSRQLIDDGELGDLFFVRGRYGHGGRVGYEREWRANPAVSGGGEMIDQGVHLVDLARWFLGDFAHVDGFAHTYFWEMPVEDNGFMLLRTETNKTAFLHASCTEWKNLFSMEVYGRHGKLEITGLGGSYGTERVTFYKMLPQMGPPETTTWEYPFPDQSWKLEFEEFCSDIRLGRPPVASLRDAQAALRVVEAVYRRTGVSYL